MQEIVKMEGHLIDSHILKAAFDRVIELCGEFEVEKFVIGKTNQDTSKLTMAVRADSPEKLEEILTSLKGLGAVVDLENCSLEEAECDGALPERFYSTTNFETHIRVSGEWHRVEKQKMDSIIVWNREKAECMKIASVKKGDLVVCGTSGIQVKPLERSRSYSIFDFMSSEVSRELNKEIIVKQLAEEIKSVKKTGGKVAFVTGPAVIHTGADSMLLKIIEAGYADVLLTGNAFAVHDIEKSLYGTSLGASKITGKSVSGGHKNHLRAINAINKAYGIKNAVEKGVLSSGIMHACVKREINFVLAGSLRDDGPLRDVISDMLDAQNAYLKALEGVGLVIILATTLHGIAVGNLIEAKVKLVCVDISESTPLKLSDRGSKQSIGIVTDVCYFTEKLAEMLIRKE